MPQPALEEALRVCVEIDSSESTAGLRWPQLRGELVRTAAIGRGAEAIHVIEDQMMGSVFVDHTEPSDRQNARGFLEEDAYPVAQRLVCHGSPRVSQTAAAEQVEG